MVSEDLFGSNAHAIITVHCLRQKTLGQQIRPGNSADIRNGGWLLTMYENHMYNLALQETFAGT